MQMDPMVLETVAAGAGKRGPARPSVAAVSLPGVPSAVRPAGDGACDGGLPSAGRRSVAADGGCGGGAGPDGGEAARRAASGGC